MAITYEVSEDGRFVHTKMTGEYTDEDLARHERALASDPRIKPGFAQLAEMAGTVAPGSAEKLGATIAEIGKTHADKFRGARYAVVVQRARDFDVAKLFETIYDGPANVIVFYNLDIAKTWLGWKTQSGPGGPLSE